LSRTRRHRCRNSCCFPADRRDYVNWYSAYLIRCITTAPLGLLPCGI
jgi:hypothetical protein